MASVSWKSSISGDWSNPANWSTGAKPGALDDVTISVSAASTVTHSTGNDTISTLYTNNLATLAVTGGSLSVTGYATIYGAVNQSGGKFSLGPASYIGGPYVQTAGTLTAAQGALRLDGTGNSFAGTIAGAAINFESGTDLLAAGSVITAAALEVTGATVTLGQNVNYTGVLQLTGGTLALGGNTFTLTGNAALDGGVIGGSGTLALSGATTLSGFYITGSTALANTGTITQTNFLYVGYYGPDTAQLQNNAGGVLRILANSTIYGQVNSSIANAGLIDKAGGAGVSNVNVTTTSTGVITVDTGTLAFNGANSSFAGSIGGAGTLALSSGSDLLASGLALSVNTVSIGNATVTEAGNMSYAGNWFETGGTLSLGGFTLSQSGAVALTGGYLSGAGTMQLNGTTEFAGTALSGSVKLTNNGVATQTNNFYDGYFGADTTRINNSAGATYSIAGNYGIYGAAGATFVNSGSLIKSAGASTAFLNVSLTTNGTVAVNQGTLRLSGPSNSLKGTISGAGRLELNTGADSITNVTLTISQMLLDGATVSLGSNVTYTGQFDQTGGTLALGGYKLTLSSASFEGGIINGAGTITTNKTANFSSGVLSGSAVLTNTGALSVAANSYIGYYGSDTAKLQNNAAGTVSLLNNASLYGGGAATITNAGSINKASGGGTSVIADSITSTGTITVTSGTLRISGASNSFSGTINGAGTFELNTGTDSFAGGASIFAGAVLLDGANVSLAGGVTIGGQFAQTAGTLALGGQTLSLTGAATFEGGAITGSGTIAATGATTAYALAIEGSTVFSNGGTLTDTNIIYCGYNASDTAQFINLAAGSVSLLSNTTVSSGGSSSFSNAGALTKTGAGTTYFAAALANTGTLTVAQGNLRLTGTTNTLGGTLAGGGQLELAGGADTISAATIGTAAVLLDGASLTLAANVADAGSFTQTTGSLALGGFKLSLTGTANLDGGSATGSGKIATSGATEIYNYYLQGSTSIANSGNITIAANTQLSVGYNASDTALLQNLATGTISLQSGARIALGGAGTFSNAGSLIASGAAAKYIAPATTNTGSIEAAQGALTFQGTVSGAGAFKIDTGASLAFSAATSGGTITLAANATLGVSTTAGFTDAIAGFTTGDLIDLNGFGYSSSTPPTLSFNTTTDKLTVTESTSSFTVQFSGTYAASDFKVINDHGVIGITHG